MQAWHRSPGNGYHRSNPMGMGIAASSRISSSPESFIRSHTKSFQPPSTPTPSTPLPQKSDIFLEAGWLAAEYLVSQGLLSPTVISSGPKWQNGNNMQNPQEGRTSALSRLGNKVSDTSSCRRRFNVDEFGNLGFRAHFKGRRKSGSSYKGHGSDWGSDYGRRRSSLSDRTNRKASLDNDNKVEDDDYISGQRDEQVLSDDVGNGEKKSKTEDAYKVESDMDVAIGSKSSSTGSEKDFLLETKDKATAKFCDDLGNLNAGTKEVMDTDCPTSVSIDDTEKPSVDEELPVSVEATKNDSFGNNATDLVSLCKISKMSTRTRSLLTYKRSKLTPAPTIQVENASVFAPQGEPGRVGDDSMGNSVNGMVVVKTDESKRAETEILEDQAIQSAEYVDGLGPANNLEQVD